MKDTPICPRRGPVYETVKAPPPPPPHPEDEGLWTTQRVLNFWGLKGRTSLHRHIAAGLIPGPVKLGPHTNRFVPGEQRAALQLLVNARLEVA